MLSLLWLSLVLFCAANKPDRAQNKARKGRLKEYVEWEFSRHKPTLHSIPKDIQSGAKVSRCISSDMMAFTFDDGPNYSTHDMLKALKELNMVGTFFVLGKHIENRPRAFLETLRANHSLAGHGWNHAGMHRMSKAKQAWSIEHQEAIIHKYTDGVIPYLNYWRTPGGATQASTVDLIVKDKNKYLCHWSTTDSFLRGDQPGRHDCMEGVTCQQACDKRYCDSVRGAYVNMMKSGTGKCPVPGSILLMHESRFTATLLPAIVNTLRENFPECRIVGMEECLGQEKLWGPSDLAHIDILSYPEDVVHYRFPQTFLDSASDAQAQL